MTLDILRTSAAEREEKREQFNEYTRLVEKAQEAAQEAEQFAWHNFDNDAYEELTTNESSPYDLRFIASELGAILIMLRKVYDR